LTGKEIENIIYAIGLVGWIPIFAIFSGIAKVVSAFKGNHNYRSFDVNIENDSDSIEDEEE